MDAAGTVLLLLLLSARGQTDVVRPLGCLMADGPLPEDLLTAAADLPAMTVQRCVTRCWRQQHKLAALQNGSRCYCADGRQGLVRADRSLCNQRCSGNCRQSCGGREAYSVFTTGYERHPVIPQLDLSAGLIGCYEWGGGQDMCEGGDHVIRTDQLTPAMLLPDATKLPLVSVRMSAQMCATYCISGANSRPVAVLKTNDTCCCGRSVERVEQLTPVSTELTPSCSAPCADLSDPPCVGRQGSRRFVSVYSTLDIWPIDSQRPLTLTLAKADQDKLHPEFPADGDLEVADGGGGRQGQRGLSGMMPRGGRPLLPAPVVDPPNLAPYVVVVDGPDDEHESRELALVLTAIATFCFLLCAAIAIVIIKRKRQASADYSMLSHTNPDDGHRMDGKDRRRTSFRKSKDWTVNNVNDTQGSPPANQTSSVSDVSQA